MSDITATTYLTEDDARAVLQTRRKAFQDISKALYAKGGSFDHTAKRTNPFPDFFTYDTEAQALCDALREPLRKVTDALSERDSVAHYGLTDGELEQWPMLRMLLTTAADFIPAACATKTPAARDQITNSISVELPVVWKSFLRLFAPYYPTSVFKQLRAGGADMLSVLRAPQGSARGREVRRVPRWVWWDEPLLAFYLTHAAELAVALHTLNDDLDGYMQTIAMRQTFKNEVLRAVRTIRGLSVAQANSWQLDKNRKRIDDGVDIDVERALSDLVDVRMLASRQQSSADRTYSQAMVDNGSRQLARFDGRDGPWIPPAGRRDGLSVDMPEVKTKSDPLAFVSLDSMLNRPDCKWGKTYRTMLAKLNLPMPKPKKDGWFVDTDVLPQDLLGWHGGTVQHDKDSVSALARSPLSVPHGGETPAVGCGNDDLADVASVAGPSDPLSLGSTEGPKATAGKQIKPFEEIEEDQLGRGSHDDDGDVEEQEDINDDDSSAGTADGNADEDIEGAVVAAEVLPKRPSADDESMQVDAPADMADKAELAQAQDERSTAAPGLTATDAMVKRPKGDSSQRHGEQPADGEDHMQVDKLVKKRVQPTPMRKARATTDDSRPATDTIKPTHVPKPSELPSSRDHPTSPVAQIINSFEEEGLGQGGYTFVAEWCGQRSTARRLCRASDFVSLRVIPRRPAVDRWACLHSGYLVLCVLTYLHQILSRIRRQVLPRASVHPRLLAAIRP